MFNEETSNATKITFVLCLILLLCLTYVYNDVNNHRKEQAHHVYNDVNNHIKEPTHHTHPRWFFSKNKNMAYDSDYTQDNKDVDTLYKMEPNVDDKALDFLKKCQENCYYHPECVAVEATRSYDEKDPNKEVITSCSLKAPNAVSNERSTDTYFIHRHQNPKNEQKLKFQASLYKYLPVVTPTVTTPLSDLS